MRRNTTEFIEVEPNIWQCQECKWRWETADLSVNFWKVCPMCACRINNSHKLHKLEESNNTTEDDE